jgi:uncharacterized repeat protein (TIGR02543 family)
MALNKRLMAVLSFLPVFLLTSCPISSSSGESLSTSTIESSETTSSETSSLPSSSEIPINYTITFESNGGTPVDPITGPAGSAVTRPSDPTKVGHTFNDWYADVNLTTVYQFTTMPSENITVYAKWDVNSYTITFEENGGSPVPDITQAYGTSVTAPIDPVRHGYTFTGWFSDAGLTTLYVFTTMPASDFTLYAGWLVDPNYGIISIADFKNLPSEDTDVHSVRGVVIFSSLDAGIVLFADATGTLIAMTDQLFDVYDQIKVTGYLIDVNGYSAIGNETTGFAAIEFEASDQALPIEPDPITIPDYALLSADDPDDWGRLLEISGMIHEGEGGGMLSLTAGTDYMNVVPFGSEAYIKLSGYIGFEVTIIGFTLPNMDEVPATLMFVYNGHDDFISLDYTDTELLDQLEAMFRFYFETPTYYPGQFVDLPSEHPIIALTVAYEPFGTNAALFDVETNRIDPSITTILDIDIHVTVTLQSGPYRLFDIKLHVDPDAFMTIAEVKALPDSMDVTYIIKAVVLMIQTTDEEGQNMLMVADSTGIIYINSSNPFIAVGDMIIAIGFKMTMGMMTFMFNDPSMTVDQIVSHDNPLPLVPITISIEDFVALSPSDPAANLVYYELNGTLMYLDPGNPDISMYGLTDGTNTALIYAVDPMARAALDAYIDESITLQAIAFLAGEEGSYMVILAYIPFPGTIQTAT